MERDERVRGFMGKITVDVEKHWCLCRAGFPTWWGRGGGHRKVALKLHAWGRQIFGMGYRVKEVEKPLCRDCAIEDGVVF